MHPQEEELIYFIAYQEQEMGFKGYGVAALVENMELKKLLKIII